MIPIPFSPRTSAAVATFASIFVASAQGAQAIPTSAVNLAALHTAYGQLVTTYPLFLNQDTANDASELASAISKAVTAVSSLSTTLASMTATGDNVILLTHYQSVVAAALAQIQAAQSDE